MKTGLTPRLRLYRRLEQQDHKSRLSTAKLLVRILRRMALTETVYLPLEILRPGRPLPEGYVTAYYREVTARLAQKWGPYDLSGIDPETNRLRLWKETVDELAKSIVAPA